ncbi:CD209 antigen-like protein C [Pseudoliparis swirei]|uniref:CD209 antigen-like protein C n=1 Tax=Pseudoliparis swirei TaxID=2059687 RepID=UPI0024BD8D68|nr:CD209 antigen-like protein C [Pseudoliparis swirei]
MDHLTDVYANVEEPSGQKKSLSKSSESVYEDVLIETLEPNRTGATLSGVKKSSCRAAAVVLGLLCLLLLTGLITLGCLFSKGNSERQTKMIQLQTSNNNLTNVQDNFQKRVEELAKQRTDLQGKIRDQHTKQGWVYFNGSMYSISSLAMSWLDSRAYCVQRFADLVIINSEEEQKFISNFKKPVWIGLTDRETEGRWKWVDGTPLTKSFWNPLEPNGQPFQRDEDCAENYYLEKNWNDDKCEHKKMGICEKMLPP